MTQRDSLPLTLEKARYLTGLDLVSAEDVCEPVSGKTYAEMERDCESLTHARLRELAIEVFITYGYQVYPSGVGVRDIFAMSDFLAVRDHRTIFIEVLTDAKATPSDLRQKQQLEQHGELAFVFIGDIKNRDPVALAVQTEAARTNDVLLGRWGWGECNHLASAHPFQRFAFMLDRGQPLAIGADIAVSEKQVVLTFSLASVPYPVTKFDLLSCDPATSALPEFANQVASAMATQLAKRLVAAPSWSHSQDSTASLSLDLEPAAAVDAIAATCQVAEEYRLALSWTGAAHEAVAVHATHFRARSPKTVAPSDINTLLQAMRAMDDVIVCRLDLLRALGWTAHRGSRVIRQLVADGVLWCSASKSGPIRCGLTERQKPIPVTVRRSVKRHPVK